MELIAAVLAAIAFHEGGHFLAALAFGHRLHFYRKGFRFLWTMPDMARWKQRVVAVAGFGAEFLIAGALAACCPSWAQWYVPVALLHLVLYPHYAGEASDFKFWR